MHMSVESINNRPSEMSRQMSNMRNIYSNSQAFGPKQYFLKDTFGNYVYGYANQNSEKREEGNDHSVQGTYTYIMSNGMKRRVDYIADDQGFHVLRDDADSSRIKRSVEPDLINTRMTSFMDSTSLRDNGQNMYTMGQDMSSMNMMDMDQHRYSNMMNRDMTGRNMNGLMGRRNIYNINQDSGMMRQQMSSNMSGRDMYNNMLGDRDMTSNMMRQGSNMLGRMDTYTTEGMMGQQQRMSQQMEMERIPEQYVASTFF